MIFTPRCRAVRKIGDINECWFKGMFEEVFSDEGVTTLINTTKTSVTEIVEFESERKK